MGAVTGLQGRCVYRLSNKGSLRGSLRLGTSGIELELGGTQRLSEFSSMGLAVSMGLQVLHPAPCHLSSCGMILPQT